jgi:hypothetical protein
MTDQHVAQTVTHTTHNKHDGRTSLPSAGFELEIPAIERSQTYALDRTTTVIICIDLTTLNINLPSHYYYYYYYYYYSRFHWPRCLRRGSAAAGLLGSWVRIPPGASLPVSFECFVLSVKRSLRWADHSSRGVLLSVVYLSVIVGPLY